jgi:hypothetical protein
MARFQFSSLVSLISRHRFYTPAGFRSLHLCKWHTYADVITGAYHLKRFLYDTHYIVPRSPLPTFVGREDILQLLHSKIEAVNQDQLIMLLYGRGGIG